MEIACTLEMNGIEKIFCAHGGWLTIAHIAHLTGDHSILTQNAPLTLQQLLKRHSRMRSRIRIDHDRSLLNIFEYGSEQLSIDSFFSTVQTTNETWQELVENRCNQNPYSNQDTIIFPLFHFMLVIDREYYQSSSDHLFHLILYSNHCVSDGRSGYTLINDFLTLATSPNLSEIVEPINKEIVPFIGHLIPRPYGRLYPLIAFIARYILKQELRHSDELRIPVSSIPHTDCEPTKFPVQRHRTKFLFASSSSNLYVNLHEQCRLHNITLHGPLLTCLLLAIHHCFPLEDTEELVPFSIEMHFDMRTRLAKSSLTSSSVGFFVASDDFFLDRSYSLHSTRFWLLAHECMRKTHKLLQQRNGIPLSMHIFCDMMRHPHLFDQITRLFPEGRMSEFDFSNIGKYPFSCDYNQGQIHLHGIHAINNSSVYRSSSTLYITCAGNDRLEYSLAHEMESHEKAKMFFDYYISLIESCARRELCQTETTLVQLIAITK